MVAFGISCDSCARLLLVLSGVLVCGDGGRNTGKVGCICSTFLLFRLGGMLVFPPFLKKYFGWRLINPNCDKKFDATSSRTTPAIVPTAREPVVLWSLVMCGN